METISALDINRKQAFLIIKNGLVSIVNKTLLPYSNNDHLLVLTIVYMTSIMSFCVFF